MQIIGKALTSATLSSFKEKQTSTLCVAVTILTNLTSLYLSDVHMKKAIKNVEKDLII